MKSHHSHKIFTIGLPHGLYKVRVLRKCCMDINTGKFQSPVRGKISICVTAGEIEHKEFK